MKKVWTSLVTFVFSVCLILGTMAPASAAALKKVSGLKADATPIAVTLTWSKAAGAKGYEIQQKSGKKWKKVATIKKQKTTTYTVKKLKNGTTYQFRVYAVNGKKKSKATTVKVKTGVQKITGVTAVSTGLKSAKLTWAKGNVTGYEIQRKVGKKWKTVKKIKKAKTVSLNVSNISAAQNNSFRIRGYVAGAAKTYYGAYTTVNVTTSVTPMKNVSVKSVTDKAVTVAWAKLSGVSGYQVQVYKNNKWTDVNTAVKNSVTQYTVSGLSAFANYQIRVRAYQKDGNKPYYNNWVAVNSKTSLGTVSGLSYTGLSADKVTVKWNAAGGAAGYRVFNNGVKVADVKTNSAVLTLKAATAYKITVTPYNGGTTGVTTAAITFTSPCAKVTGLNVMGITDSTASLSWNAVAGASKYKIQYSKDGKTWIDSMVTDTKITITKLDANTNYSFKVSAVNYNNSSEQNGVYSDVVAAKTLLGVATKLTVSNIKAKSANISWVAARGAESYRIFNSNDLLAETSSTSAVLALNPATNYNITVVAVANNAVDTASTILSFTTAPDVVVNVVAKKMADKVRVSWDEVSGAKGYEIQYRLANNSTWSTCDFTEDTTYLVDNLVLGTSAAYRVCAYNYNGTERQSGEFSNATDTVVTSAFFTNVDDSTNTIAWNAIDGVAGYKVSSYDFDDGKWESVTNFISQNTATIDTVKDIDLLRVEAYDETRNLIYTSSAFNFADKGYAVTQNGNNVQIVWPEIAGAESYKLVRFTQKNTEETITFNSSARSATMNIAPGLIHIFEIKAGSKTIAKFAVEGDTIKLNDKTDNAVNSQLLYLAEAVNRSKYDYSHLTYIDTNLKMTNNINYMEFGIMDLGPVVSGTVDLAMYLAFKDVLEGNYDIDGGYIKCYDQKAVNSLFGAIGESGDDSSVTEVTRATFNKSRTGWVQYKKADGTYGDSKSMVLDQVIQPANMVNQFAEIYNSNNASAWKNGFESVNMTKTNDGYKIVAVIKSEKSDSVKGIEPVYHAGLVNAISGTGIDLGLDGGKSTVKSVMGKTTLTAEIDSECRLKRYEINMPYQMDMNIVLPIDFNEIAGDGENNALVNALKNMDTIKIEVSMNMSGSQHSVSTFSRTK